MDTQTILALYDRTQRLEVEVPDMRKDVFPHLVRFVRPAPGMSHVGYSCLDESNADAVIVEQIAYFSELNQPFDWKVYSHDTPADLADRLVRHGLQADEEEAIMVLDLHNAPMTLLEPVQADIRPIERDQLGDVVRVMEAVWGGDFAWIYERLGSHLEIPGYLNVYVAYVENKPACAGWIYFDLRSSFASLWAGSTLAEYRKQGLYTALLAVRVQEATRRGYRYLTIDAGPMSQPIVERHGFAVLTYARDCKWRGEGRE